MTLDFLSLAICRELPPPRAADVQNGRQWSQQTDNPQGGSVVVMVTVKAVKVVGVAGVEVVVKVIVEVIGEVIVEVK